MNKKIPQKPGLIFIVLLSLFFTQLSFSQLSAFTLNITKTDETCTGNGALNFQVFGATPGASMIYSIYQLPNITAAVATLSANSYSGLSSGNYLVIATQTLGGFSNTQQQTVTINNIMAPLTFQLSGTNVICGNGAITANITSGNPVSYSIISGPVTMAAQTSNVFSNLPVGIYVIRVYDTCGDAVVQTFTLQYGSLILDSSPTSDCALINCNTISVNCIVSATTNAMISYPYTVQYTISPPTGIPIVLSQIITSGTGTIDNISMGIPYFNGQNYSYTIKVTDNCGNSVSSNLINMSETLSLEIVPAVNQCAVDLKISVCDFLPPFTVSFVSAPAGFNPAFFNSGHPGPFFTPQVIYPSNSTHQIPNGIYIIKITDACGRFVQNQIDIEETLEPGSTVLPEGCNLGVVMMPNQTGSMVASVIMTAAPLTYTHAIPYDVSFLIADGHFTMQHLPSGTYSFTVVSVCGTTFFYTVIIPPALPESLYTDYRKGCGVDVGSIKLGLDTAALVMVIITAAPVTFLQTLPYDVSFNLSGGKFYMNSLPEGLYTFYLKDSCGFERIFSLNVPGYQVTQNNVVVDANCGSFNLLLQYADNETSVHDYWLQKFNPLLNQWVHPITGIVYPAGSMPALTNSYLLANNTNNLNIASTGSFRLLKVTSIYSNGNSNYSLCLDDIKDFEFSGGPKITTAYSLPCPTNAGNVVIVAEGLAPLSYTITTKDNQPFFISNGISNTFTGLQPGVYNFQVRDVCGNVVNRLFDLTSIPQPSISQSILCDGQNGQLLVQNFPFLNYQWWMGTNTTTILSTTNVLNFSPFSNVLNPGTYYVRIYSTTAGICTDQIIAYTVPPAGITPSAGAGTISDVCGSSGSIDLFTMLTGSYAAGGTWTEVTSSGMLVGHSWLPVGIPYGTYKFKYKVNGLCGASNEADVEIHFNAIPSAPTAAVDTIPCGATTVQLTADTIVGAAYQWTGPNGFTSNVQNPLINPATTLSNGIYSVKALSGMCTSVASSVTVKINALPDFNVSAGCDLNEYVIRVTPTGDSFVADAASYSWTGPENYISSANPVTISGGKKGTYNVTITLPNGCSASKSIEIVNTLCSIPKGISPNDDGKNETLDLTGYDILKFKIFSRWGRMVFEQDDYTNQWHGQDYNGNDLPSATYYYYIRLTSGEEKTGWVYISR